MNLWLYILRRVGAMVPTLFGISLVSFLLINAAPGGPIEQRLSQLRFAQGASGSSSASANGSGNDSAVTKEVIEALKRQYGFDKPVHIRYLIWVKRMMTFDFGESFTYHRPVWDLIKSKFPVSLMLGLVSFMLGYLISIPLGIFKAVKRGSIFDVASSALIFILYSVPAFMLAILMVVSMGPGGLNWFPIQGLASENYESLDLMGKIVDRIRHAVMPLLAYTIGGYATLTILMKNSLIEELGKDYVRTARAKGLTERLVIGRHAFRNALMPIATGLGSVLSVFLAGSLLLETIFNLDGIGLLGYQSVLSRDFNVIMGIAMLSSFAALFGNLLSDITYVLIDPRIDFSAAVE